MNWFAGVVVLDQQQKILSLHFREEGKGWRIPGGKLNVNQGESAESAALRELKEETGLELTAGQLRYIGYHDLAIDGKQWIGYIFLAKSWSGEPKIMEQHKHDAMRFIDREELKILNPILASDIEMLEKVL